jgi:hypothetical protein
MTVSQKQSIQIASFFITSLCIGYLLGAQTTHAQVIPTAGPGNIDISITPEHPSPYTDITVKLQSFFFRMDLANIIWMENGVRKSGGPGVTTYKTKTGGVGERTEIEAIINIAGYDMMRKSISISPSDIDILWESPDSYVPPFYRGKALSAREGLLRITAIPVVKNRSGEILRHDNLSYTWKRGLRVAQTDSGFGKTGYTFRNLMLNRNENIIVDIVSQNGYSGSASITIPIFEPKVLLYPQNEGVVNYLQSLNMGTRPQRSNISVRAVPYFFSIDPNGGQLGSVDYEWKLGQEIIPTRDAENADHLLLISERPGNARISVSLKNNRWPFQQASTSTQIRLTQ